MTRGPLALYGPAAGSGAGPPELRRRGAAEPLPRWWSELVADTGDWFPGGVTGLFLALLALAGVAAFALLWRPRRRTAKPAPPTPPVEPDGDEVDDHEVPELPPEQLRSLADQYAAAGRYAEAVRERLRAMVRELVEHGVVEHRPGWTVTELAAAAGRALPAVGPALTEAAGIFSDIWYGRTPAGIAHDGRMRELESDVRTACGALSRRNGSATATAEPADTVAEAGT